MLKLDVANPDAKQREVNLSVLLVPGFSRNLQSSSAAAARGVGTLVSSFLRPLVNEKTFHRRAAFCGRIDTGTAIIAG